MPAYLTVGAPSLGSMSGEAGWTANAIGANWADTEGRRGKELETFVTRSIGCAREMRNVTRGGRGDQRERTRRVVVIVRGGLIRIATMMHALHALVMLMLGVGLLLNCLRREQRLHHARGAEHQLQPARVHRHHEASRDQRPRDEQRENPEAQQFEVMATHDCGREYTRGLSRTDTSQG